MFDIQEWDTTINECVTSFAGKTPKSQVADLRQDLYVAILEHEAAISSAPTKEDARKIVVMACFECINGRTEIPEDSIEDPEVTRHAREIDPKLKIVAEAVLRLPEPEQTVVRLIFYENRSEEEVALYLGQSLRYVRKTRSSAVHHLFLEMTKEKRCL